MSDQDNFDPTPVTIPRWVLQAVFDVAVGSLDFGSGLLCDDDVLALRELAKALGVDPETASPSAFGGGACFSKYAADRGLTQPRHSWVRHSSNGKYQCSTCKTWREMPDDQS